ncbi:MAG TPA: hypothetical protein PK847_13625 [Candidatus Sumerlaeota bacterium]|nr:hypothetical protein [Candidatus Sumerlaeota bacterium]HOR27780.1 hypothetical protein [Candidatus Sumerlaeota bacterium]
MSDHPAGSLGAPPIGAGGLQSGWPAYAIPAALFLSGAAIFFLLRPFGVPGGDSELLTSPQSMALYWRDSLVYFMREPLAHQIALQFHLAAGDLALGMALSGAFCGGLFLVLLWEFCRSPIVWAAVLGSCLTWVFVGHLELYAPVAVTLLLYFMLLVRALQPGSGVTPFHAALALALAYLTHKLALFFAPALLCLAFERVAGRWRIRPWPAGAWERALVAIIAMCLIDMLPALADMAGVHHILYITFNEHFLDMITPLTPSMARRLEARSETGMFFLFTFGTPLHLAHCFGFILASAPLGLVLLARHWRRIRSAAALPLIVAAVIGILWILLWHPRCGWRDWDLFSMGTLPLNLLGGGAAAGWFDADAANPPHPAH